MIFLMDFGFAGSPAGVVLDEDAEAAVAAVGVGDSAGFMVGEAAGGKKADDESSSAIEGTVSSAPSLLIPASFNEPLRILRQNIGLVLIR
jgi:hypothetical protein